MSLIYKIEAHDEEAIHNLFTRLQKTAHKLNDLYYGIAVTDATFINVEDIMLDTIIMEGNMLRVFDQFMIMKTASGISIIECDLLQGNIYAYNFDGYDVDSLDDMMANINACFINAHKVNLYNEWDASTVLKMNTLLHATLQDFNEYADVTLEEVDDILDWIGYTKVNHKELH